MRTRSRDPKKCGGITFSEKICKNSMRISVKISGKEKMKQSMEKIIISLLTIAQTGNKILFMPVQSQPVLLENSHPRYKDK